MLKALFAAGCACWLTACASTPNTSASSAAADIAKIADIRSSFGPEFQVTNVAPRAIDPTLLAARTLPDGLKFEPANCAKLGVGPAVPPGLQGNMAAVSAEGDGNRFVTVAVETSEPVPLTDPGPDCMKVGFTGAQVRGAIEAVDPPQIVGTHTLGAHRVLQTLVDGTPRTGELYDYSAYFGSYQVIVIANPLVLAGKPVVAVDSSRARDLLVKAVAAIRS